jgi:L-ascorbate metabolism protein UlaG (beta-lactamase superfamily)
VVTDPPSDSVGYSIPTVAADAVTVMHNHADHNNTAGVKGNFQVVDGRTVGARTQMTAANLPFMLNPGFHDGQNGAATGPNTIIQWTQSGLRFAQMGDMGQDALTDVQLADLPNMDVMLFPAGGYFTVDPDQAAALVARIGARVTILETIARRLPDRLPFPAGSSPGQYLVSVQVAGLQVARSTATVVLRARGTRFRSSGPGRDQIREQPESPTAPRCL